MGSQLYFPHVHYTKALPRAVGRLKAGRAPFPGPEPCCGIAFAWRRGTALDPQVRVPLRCQGLSHLDQVSHFLEALLSAL